MPPLLMTGVSFAILTPGIRCHANIGRQRRASYFYIFDRLFTHTLYSATADANAPRLHQRSPANGLPTCTPQITLSAIYLIPLPCNEILKPNHVSFRRNFRPAAFIYADMLRRELMALGLTATGTFSLLKRCRPYCAS